MSVASPGLKSSLQQHDIFAQISEYEHEQVVFCFDKQTGLKSIIAIHSTVLGPSLGGTRFWNYEREADALTDVLRLSRGMTYKAAITGLNLGGGKAVIIGDPKKLRSEAFFRRYGKFVNSLNGKYYTAEDVNTNSEDMANIAYETKFVTGKPEYLGGGGDPSPVTAYGTFLGIKASVKELTGSDDLLDKTVLVQGVGHVGEYLVKLLVEAGARVRISDINTERLREISKNYKVEVVNGENEYTTDMDVYAPCALGATVNDITIPLLKCSIIAGSANNQLADEVRHGNMLKDRGVIYAPDFLINAGGLINVGLELGEYNREYVYSLTEKIYDRTLQIFRTANKENITTHEAALRLAEERIQQIGRLKTML